MPTLDLLSQVLFVALMAMFLYVLYRRFVAMTVSYTHLRAHET